MTKRHRAEGHSHMIGELFTFALLGLFLLLSLLIVVIGVDGYRRVVDTSESVGAVRTTLGYVAGKMRSEASTDGVRIEEHEDGTITLVLTERINGKPYETIIYHADGALHEAYISADELDFSPDFGTRLTAVASLDFHWVDADLLELTATAADGRSQSLCLAVRTGEEVLP